MIEINLDKMFGVMGGVRLGVCLIVRWIFFKVKRILYDWRNGKLNSVIKCISLILFK